MRPSTISKKEKKISIRYIARQWKVNYYMGFPNTFFLKKTQIPWRVSSEEFLLKPYSTQDVLVRMLEEWQETLDNNFFVGAVLTYLSKSFGCLPHDSLIAKLSTCGFDNDSLCYIYSYLKKWQWCVLSMIKKGVLNISYQVYPRAIFSAQFYVKYFLTILFVALQKLQL